MILVCYILLAVLFVGAWTDIRAGKVLCGCCKEVLRAFTIFIYFLLIFTGFGLSIISAYGNENVTPFIENFLLPWSIGTTVVNNLFLVPTIVLKYLSRKAANLTSKENPGPENNDGNNSD
jgi:hypothetical protein